jgi:glycosyltransferase involved in cell wall biosynthesis
VRALRDIGVEARCLVCNNSPLQGSEGIENYEIVSPWRHPLRWGIQKLTWWNAVQSAIRWADVIHLHFMQSSFPANLDLKFIAYLNKACIVEVWGSDIRIPEIATVDNPYLARVYQEYPALAQNARMRSIQKQTLFARHGFSCLIPGVETETYIQKDIFPTTYMTRTRLILSEFDPKYPDPNEQHPLIVHAPSKKNIKGTKEILDAIEQLKGKYNFDFKLVHNLEHAKSLEIIRNCDIMVDQLSVGSYGVAALEAMAFGKPTICYLKSSLIPKYPSDLPIVNANPDTIVDVLESLLVDKQRRYTIGRKSRSYVEANHDAHKITRQLITIYQELLEKNRKLNKTGNVFSL